MTIKTTRYIYILLIALIIILPIVFFASGFFASASEKVFPGIEVMGIRLDGLTREEGLAKLEDLEDRLRSTRVIMYYQDRSWPLLLSEVGFRLNKEAVMEAALAVGRQGSILQRLQDRRQIASTGLSLQPVYDFDRDELSWKVKDLTREVEVLPQNATLYVEENDTVTVLPGKDGLEVDLDRLEQDIGHVLMADAKPKVQLILVPVQPERTTEDVKAMGVTDLLAIYSTRFDPTKVSRTYNISVAAKAFDDLLVKPGEEVSFNRIVGPRSSEAGYKTAPVIINNEFVDGLGGGVCQVSTTLYNCALLSNLQVTERHNHSIPVSYVPIGRDATVVYDTIDLKFQNNPNNYLFFKSYVYGGQIIFKIYGNSLQKKDVIINTWVTQEIEPLVIYESDPNLPEGERLVRQEGAKGFKVSAERVIRANGAAENRERIQSSYYNAVNRIIAVGTMPLTNQIKPYPNLPEGEESGEDNISDNPGMF